MPKRTARIHRIIDQDGNACIPPEHEKYRTYLEREAEKDKKESIEARNTQRINGPMDGPWLSGHELSEKGIPGFVLFRLVSYFRLHPHDSNGEEFHPLEMPDVDHWEGREEYPLESKKTAIQKLVSPSCLYLISELLEIPELAAILKPASANENLPVTPIVPSSGTQAPGTIEGETE